MITFIQYLTKPKLPKEYDGRIYKHLWYCAMIEGASYTLIALMF